MGPGSIGMFGGFLSGNGMASGQWSGGLTMVRVRGGVLLLDTVWSRHLNIDDTTHHQLAGNVGATFHNTNTAKYT